MFQKQSPGRNQNYRDLARGKDCTLRVPGVCCGNPETTVLAHSNKGAHGKGMGLKADDAVGAVWACYTCHSWLDRGKAPQADKDAAVARAMDRMEIELQKIAGDVLVKQKDREAAVWALRRLIEFYNG